MGPRTEPWGTPDWQLDGPDVADPMRIVWERSNEYEVSQVKAEPITPKLVERRFSKMEWSIVLNAALKSNDIRKVGLLWTAER